MSRLRCVVATLAVGSAAVGLVALALGRSPAGLGRVRASFRTSSSPGPAAYETLFERLLGGFYDQVADDVVRALGGVPEPRVLEVGPGPGALALRLATRHPTLGLTGLDVDPGVTARAGARAAAAGLGQRVTFRVGDVAAMPLDDASFDLVVSTFSAHHWADARGGFAEIARVVRPDGRVLVYDVPDRWGRFETGAPRLAVVAATALPGARVSPVRWPGRVELVRRLDAVREA